MVFLLKQRKIYNQFVLIKRFALRFRYGFATLHSHSFRSFGSDNTAYAVRALQALTHIPSKFDPPKADKYNKQRCRRDIRHTETLCKIARFARDFAQYPRAKALVALVARKARDFAQLRVIWKFFARFTRSELHIARGYYVKCMFYFCPAKCGAALKKNLNFVFY